MRFSALTVIAFLAHTSTLAIAAPLPISNEVQELVARADDPGSSPSGSGSSGLGKGTSRLQAQLLNIPVRSGTASLAQTILSAARTQPPRPPRRARTLPLPSPVEKTPSKMDALRSNTVDAFKNPSGNGGISGSTSPGGGGGGGGATAAESSQQTKKMSVSEALEESKRLQAASSSSQPAPPSREGSVSQSSSRQASPERRASTGGT